MSNIFNYLSKRGFIRIFALMISLWLFFCTRLSAQNIIPHTTIPDYEILFTCPDSVIYEIYKKETFTTFKDELCLSIYFSRLSSLLIDSNLHKEAIDLLTYSEEILEDSLIHYKKYDKYYQYAKSILYKAYDITNQFSLVETYIPNYIDEIWDKKDKRFVEYLKNLEHQAHSIYVRGYFDEAISIYKTTIQLFKDTEHKNLAVFSLMELSKCYFST